MVQHGHYLRGIKGEEEKIKIYRYKCSKCVRTVAILPDFLLPYKQYSTDEIESIIVKSQSTRVSDIDTEASESTVYRWIKEMNIKMEKWISLLKAHLLKIENRIQSELTFKGLSLIEHLEVVTEELPKIKSSGSKLGRAAIYISNIYNYFSSKRIST
jgi:hypothetical protein